LGTGIGTTTNATNGTATAQLNGLRGRATQLETDVNTIATELGMISNNTITGNNSKIDTIEYNISHTATQNDNTTGLM